MKKIIIGTTAVTLSVALVGCGNSGNNAAINSLSSQLDSTANTISSVKTINPTDFNLTKETLDTIATRENSNTIYDNVIGAQQSLLGEEYYKMDILNKTSILKNQLSKNLRLSNAQIKAVKELTSNLNKYTNSVEYTKNEMTSTVKSIASMKKNISKNSDFINAKLNRLACNSNTRSAYYANILKTLSELETYINCQGCQEDTTPLQDNLSNSIKTDKNQTDAQNSSVNQKELQQQSFNQNTQKKGLTKNIDTYLPSQQSNNNQNHPECTNNCNENITNPYSVPNANNFNRANGFYGNATAYGNGLATPGNPYYGNFGYGAGYGNMYGGNFGYGNGPVYGTGMKFGYGPYGAYNSNNINFARFNPNRNTDTYAPMQRNIDTYALPSNPNTAYGAPLSTPVAAEAEKANLKKDFETEIAKESLSKVEISKEKDIVKQASPKAEQTTLENANSKSETFKLLNTNQETEFQHQAESKNVKETKSPEEKQVEVVTNKTEALQNSKNQTESLKETFLQLSRENDLKQPTTAHTEKAF